MAVRKAPREVSELRAVEPDADTLYAAFAVLQDAREGRTRNQDPFFDVELADSTRSLRGKIWADASSALEAVRELSVGSAVKVLFHAELYKGALQLTVRNIRTATEEDEGYDETALFGEGYEHVKDVLCRQLVFDIETVPATDRRGLPQTIAESLARQAERLDSDEAKVMGLSPFFGKVVSLAIADADDPDLRVTAFVVPPEGADVGEFPDWMRPVTEPELLQAWWALAAAAETVISFNGRGFDVPFLIARSLVHRIPARVDLVSHRFSLRPHLDLYRALTHGERALGPTNLDVVCWSLGIQSPKGEMDGSMVGPAYERGEIERIATYNAQDVRATAAVYLAVRDHVLAFREDW